MGLENLSEALRAQTLGRQAMQAALLFGGTYAEDFSLASLGRIGVARCDAGVARAWLSIFKNWNGRLSEPHFLLITDGDTKLLSLRDEQ